MKPHSFDCGSPTCQRCADTRLNIAINTHAFLIKSPVEVSETPRGILVEFESGAAFSVEAVAEDQPATLTAMAEALTAASAPLIAEREAAEAAAAVAQVEEVVVP
jgi:hypothetical protein